MALALGRGKRHLALHCQPVKRHRKSLQAECIKDNRPIGVMSDYKEFPASEVPPVTPEGKNEILAVVTHTDKDNMISEILARLGKLEAATIRHSNLLASARALHLRFLADYSFNVYFLADYSFNVYKEGADSKQHWGCRNFPKLLEALKNNKEKEKTVPTFHTLRGFALGLTAQLSPEIATHLDKLKKLSKVLSISSCHTSSVRTLAEVVTDPETEKVVDHETLVSCKMVFEALFGPTENVLQNDYPGYMKEFPLPVYAEEYYKSRTAS